MSTVVEKFCSQVLLERQEILDSWLNKRESSLNKMNKNESLFVKGFPEIIKFMVEYVRSNTSEGGIEKNIAYEINCDIFHKILPYYDMDILVEELILLKYEMKYFMIRNNIYEISLQEKVSDSVLHVVKFLSGIKNDIFKKTMSEEISLREEFVLNLTHDLRGPLSAAKLIAQLLEKKSKEATVLNYIPKLIENINRCEELVSNILDAKKIRLGEKIPLKKKMVNTRDIINECLDELRVSYGERFVVLAEDFFGQWDLSAVKRIIINLASNAVKYGDKNKKITIGVKLKNDHAHFWIQNFGHLIAPEDQNVIFKQYKRLKPGSEQKGWGLGLNLVKGLAEAHRGRVEVKSNESEGTVFTIILPLNLD